MFRQRTQTDPALARARAAQRAPTLPSQASTGRVQEWYPAYANFPWENIERFLKQKWPNWNNFNPSKATDIWQFEVPERLTEGDKSALRELRDAPKRTRRPSVSD